MLFKNLVLFSISTFLISCSVNTNETIIINTNQINTFSSNTDIYKNLDNYIDKINKDNKFNGSVYLKANNIDYKKSIGFSDFNKKLKIDENTSFNIASCSKQFTSFGIMLLKERNKLNYDDKITKYIPELKLFSNITIRHLLNQVSGIPDYLSKEIDPFINDYFNKNKSKSMKNKDIVNILSNYNIKPMFKPLEKFDYSNTNAVLLAYIIEKIEKTSFKDFIEKNIFKKLDMSDSFVLNIDSPPINRALGYNSTNSGYEINDLSFYDGVVGDGNIYISINDFIKWEESLYTEKLIKQSSLLEAFNKITLKDGTQSSYGFGWDMINSNVMFHNGSWLGFRSFIIRNINNKFVLIILNNSSNDLDKISQEIISVIQK
ncbi:MAG: serine hydrolase domain-containing protein [Candidatus Sericytochromatia bacterium]